MQETGAEVIGLDWRIPLDTGWQTLGNKGAVQATSIRYCSSPIGKNSRAAPRTFCAKPPDRPATSSI